MKETVLLSGGLDSTTLLASRVQLGGDVDALFVDLGQPAREEEQVSSREVAKHYGVDLCAVRVSGLNPTVGEITGRNLLLLTAALAKFGSANPRVYSIAIHAGTAYWDCSTDFVTLAQRLLDGYADGRAQLNAPFVSRLKHEIIALAHELHVPIGKTYSCEQASGPCQACLSCRDRAMLDAPTT